MRPELKISRTINDEGKRGYGIWLTNHETKESNFVRAFKSLDEAIYYATYELDYTSDEIIIDF